MTTPTAEDSRALLATLTGYTRGPWLDFNHPGDWGLPGAYSVISGDGKTEIAHIHYVTPYCLGSSKKERDDAVQASNNARLIAASPDLAAHLAAALDREAAEKARAEKLREVLAHLDATLSGSRSRRLAQETDQ